MIDSKDLKENLPLRIVQGIAIVAVIYWVFFSPSKPKEEKKVDPQDAQVLILWNMIEATARDKSSLQFGKETRYKDSVCLEVNGKNAFGGYTGFKDYCLVTQQDGSRRMTINGEYQK
jgi:hypothetical protein